MVLADYKESMNIVNEIDLTKTQQKAIETLRNQSFPDHQVERSYFKQLPHMRALQYEENQLIGYLGLDYRVIKVGDMAYKVLGVIDFCVAEQHRRQNIGSSMLSEVSSFAENRDVDFIMLISDLKEFYSSRGYININGTHSWLRLHEHTNYGVAVEHIDEFYVKPISGKRWAEGDVDWLGYMY